MSGLGLRIASQQRQPRNVLERTRAIDGKVTAYFESLYPRAPDTQPGEIRPTWAIGPEADPDSAWQTCMALVEQQTGLGFERRWTETALPTYRIPDPDAMLRDVDNAREP